MPVLSVLSQPIPVFLQLTLLFFVAVCLGASCPSAWTQSCILLVVGRSEEELSEKTNYFIEVSAHYHLECPLMLELHWQGLSLWYLIYSIAYFWLHQ